MYHSLQSVGYILACPDQCWVCVCVCVIQFSNFYLQNVFVISSVTSPMPHTYIPCYLIPEGF